MKKLLVIGSLLSGLAVATSSAFAAAPISNFTASFTASGADAGSTSTIYNVSGLGNSAYYTGNAYGDEVVFGGTDRVLRSISFEYYANYAQAGGISFNLWSKADAASLPGASIYSTTADIVNGGGVVTINFAYDAGANTLPDRLVFTAQFAGVSGANVAGLIIPDANPSVGASANDFWEKTGPGATDWTLTQVVPEPSTVALFSVAGAAFLGMLLFRRNK